MKAASGAGRLVGIEAVRLTLDDIRSPPIEEFILGRMIPFAKASVLFGPTSVGKSAAAAQIVIAFAAGAESLWGLPVYRDPESEERGGPVLVYTAEDDLDDWKRKAAAIQHAGGIGVQRALQRLYVIDQSEGVARLTETVSVRSAVVDPQNPESITRRVARGTAEQERIILEARKVGARLILVETASRLVEDEDNPNFAALQSALGRIARETGAAVIVTHHSTKAASKENDSAIESARGGGALVANARNVLALYPADAEIAQAYSDRFPVEDLVVLTHLKATSSTKRHPPITLVRTDATWGAVFRLPDEVARTPEEEIAFNARMAERRQREEDHLARLYDVVARYLPQRPSLSPSWLRDHCHAEIGVPKNGPRGVEALVSIAIQRGVLKVKKKSERGITVCLGDDPRRPSPRADAGESVEPTP